MNDIAKLSNTLLKTEIYDSVLGVGSFFNIFSKNESGDVLDLWIYNIRWAITKDNIEINSSENINIDNFKIVKDLMVGSKYSDFVVIDEFELHILFNDIALECWVDNAADDDGLLEIDFMYLFKNEKFIYKASSPLVLSDQTQ